MLAPEVAFLAVGALLIAMAALAAMRIGLLRVQSRMGRPRDGLRTGTRAPAWELVDSVGVSYRCPPGTKWQLLLFADHSISIFPRLATAVAALAARESAAEVLMVSRAPSEVAVAVCKQLNLEIPVIQVDNRFYKRHNVWVMPHILIIDPNGRVRASGNVSEPATLQSMWRYATSASEALNGQIAVYSTEPGFDH